MGNGYVVALRWNKLSGAYEGGVTWTIFESKSKFEEWLQMRNVKDQDVVEEGITEARAIELVKTTPIATYLRVAEANATNPETGEINERLLQYEVVMAVFAIRHKFE